MKRRLRARPTKYRGVQYRSKLEATWAAFFDQVGWPFEYEPEVYPGWAPDFLLMGATPVLVEVKPLTRLDEFGDAAPVLAKMGAAVPNGFDLLLVGVRPGLPKPPGCAWGAGLGNPPLVGLLDERHESGHGFGLGCGLLANMGGRLDLFHDMGSFHGRVTGLHDGDHHLGSVEDAEVETLWAEAKNAAQFLPPR